MRASLAPAASVSGNAFFDVFIFSWLCSRLDGRDLASSWLHGHVWSLYI